MTSSCISYKSVKYNIFKGPKTFKLIVRNLKYCDIILKIIDKVYYTNKS